MTEPRDPELDLPMPVQFLRHARRYVAAHGIDDRHGRFRQFCGIYQSFAPLWPTHDADAVYRQLRLIFEVSP